MTIEDLLADQRRSVLCGRCDAPVRWVHTADGHAFALDAEPSPDGNVVYVGRTVINDRRTERPEVRIEDMPPMFDDGLPRYTVHGCP